MIDITGQIQTYYRYNGKFYTVSNRKEFRLGDIFFDGRDYGIKIINSAQDYVSVAYMAPELYCILEETTVQN